MGRLVLGLSTAASVAVTGAATGRQHFGNLAGFVEHAPIGLDVHDRDARREMLDWAVRRVPERAVLLYLTPQPGLTYFRVSYFLYPRTVWSAAPSPPGPQNDWIFHVRLDGDDLARIIAQERVEYVLVEEIDPAVVPALAGAEITWYSRDPVGYLARLEPP